MKLTKYGWVPDPSEVKDGKWTPDPKVTGRRFEPNPDGSGTLYIRRRRMRPGFREPIEDWIAVKKLIYVPEPFKKEDRIPPGDGVSFNDYK